ncbi:MAG: VWA domain-containing protein [Acidobacteria bacterium]|nr:VWA domain-containing protein [Acidobacteriota bacterium]
MRAKDAALASLQAGWEACWPAALAAWSPFLRLRPPTWRLREEDEGIYDSIAMIRLLDHTVVINLRKIQELGLDQRDPAIPAHEAGHHALATAILAHEAGHHALCPADLADNGRLLARMRAGLPTREAFAGLAANLYADLLVNDRLQRGAGLDMAAVYRALRGKTREDDRLWRLYMRIYEVLWALPGGTLAAAGPPDPALEVDAGLGARVVRVYAKDWLKGAGRFAALLLPYFLEIPEQEGLGRGRMIWLDTAQAGAGIEVPDGLAEIEADEEAAVHPAEDPLVTGEAAAPEKAPVAGDGKETVGGVKTYRDPEAYTALMRGLGVDVPEQDLVARYYRERAIPHLIRFPVKVLGKSMEPQPEGVDVWDTGRSPQEIDWVETAVRSPVVIPGVTTVRRLHGAVEGPEPARVPTDLYLGIDCSGSMLNPAAHLSHPVLAGAIVALSALRAGARVMACLSGEPGKFHQTRGFIRNPAEVLEVLVNYLGTGYAFGVLRLEDAFLKGPPPRNPVHVMVVSDHDIFHMLEDAPDGWGVAARALAAARGGGTFVLHMPESYASPEVQRLREQGWNVHFVNTQEEMVDFARAFARRLYRK